MLAVQQDGPRRRHVGVQQDGPRRRHLGVQLDGPRRRHDSCPAGWTEASSC